MYFERAKVVGHGVGGELHAAELGGERVWVEVIAGARSEAGALAEQADALRSCGGPGLAVPAQVLAGGSSALLVYQPARGGTLAGLLERRPSTPEDAVVAGGARLAAALARLHGANMAHGAVQVRAVWFDAAGRPELAGAGLAWLLGWPARPGPMASWDVWGLGVLLRESLGERRPSKELARLLAAATAKRPAARPSAAELAGELGELEALRGDRGHLGVASPGPVAAPTAGSFAGTGPRPLRRRRLPGAAPRPA